jgi:outer membrane protein OmpA-like peptidoglycan-associated protein
MRITYLSTIAGTALLVGVPPAIAQQQAEPTVEGYLCTFAGKCGNVPEAELPTRAAPATKGFRIARPGAPNSAKPTAVRASSADYVARAPRSNVAPARRPSAVAGYTPVSRVSEGARADLMVGFELNSAKLTGDGMAKARVFARALQMPELRDKRFLIEGHTDSLGGVPFNMELSRRRAEAVADYLSSQGVGRGRVEIRGFGPSIPLPGRRADDPHNRRVEAKLIS